MEICRRLIIDSLKSQLAFKVINKYGQRIVSKNLILISHSLQDNFKALEVYEKRKITQKLLQLLPMKIYLGLKVSKKCGRTAVIRNVIKRRVKACMRQVISENFGDKNNAHDISCTLSTQGYIKHNDCYITKRSNSSLLSRAYLIIPHRHIIKASYLELSNELKKLLKHLSKIT
ncbi:ribonuclease P family protein [Orientia chuto str. Dubai]|uniref:Ribonuclease P protein component n=1 Tax=Orientia chuto str. Dubai TaxID=1359168 RepID=A0A0F3MP47_9RICK|nr:ribonuclease P protein component [Candidatus Orientia mediorientalis]KJV57520.1 ribonuclease P family protein [Orientia chuto str. Dubai]